MLGISTVYGGWRGPQISTIEQAQTTEIRSCIDGDVPARAGPQDTAANPNRPGTHCLVISSLMVRKFELRVSRLTGIFFSTNHVGVEPVCVHVCVEFNRIDSNSIEFRLCVCVRVRRVPSLWPTVFECGEFPICGIFSFRTYHDLLEIQSLVRRSRTLSPNK